MNILQLHLWHQKIESLDYCCRYLRDPAFSHFGTISACDRQTDRQTDKGTDRRTDTKLPEPQHIPR